VHIVLPFYAGKLIDGIVTVEPSLREENLQNLQQNATGACWFRVPRRLKVSVAWRPRLTIFLPMRLNGNEIRARAAAFAGD